MKKRRLSYLTAVTAMMAAGIIASCSTDSGYDLSDIDSTMKFEARDLIVPLQVDSFDLDEEKDGQDINIPRITKYTKVWNDWASDDMSYLVVKSGEATMTVYNAVNADMDVTLSLDGHSYIKSESDTTRYAGDNYLTGTVSVPAKGTTTTTIPLTIGKGIGLADIYGAHIVATNTEPKVIPDTSNVKVMSFKIKVNGYYMKEF